MFLINKFLLIYTKNYRQELSEQNSRMPTRIGFLARENKHGKYDTQLEQ